MLMDNILHNLRTQQKIQEKQHQSDLIQNKEPTCRLNWSEKRSRNKRSRIFFAALFFAYACYDVFFILWFLMALFFFCCSLLLLWWFKSKTVRMYYPECIKPISFNISLCIYLNICHYFARDFFSPYIYRSRTGRVHKDEFLW